MHLPPDCTVDSGFSAGAVRTHTVPCEMNLKILRNMFNSSLVVALHQELLQRGTLLFLEVQTTWRGIRFSGFTIMITRK